MYKILCEHINSLLIYIASPFILGKILGSKSKQDNHRNQYRDNLDRRGEIIGQNNLSKRTWHGDNKVSYEWQWIDNNWQWKPKIDEVEGWSDWHPKSVSQIKGIYNKLALNHISREQSLSL